MKTCSGLLVLFFLIPAGAARAETVQPVADDNVVVIAVNDVRLPATLPGQCVAKGVITQVVSGSQFQAGQSIAIRVACGHRTPILDEAPDGAPRPGGVDAMILAQSKKAIVRLDDTGAVVWRPSSPVPTTPQWGRVAGYVVLDGVKVPLNRQAG